MIWIDTGTRTLFSGSDGSFPIDGAVAEAGPHGEAHSARISTGRSRCRGSRAAEAPPSGPTSPTDERAGPGSRPLSAWAAERVAACALIALAGAGCSTPFARHALALSDVLPDGAIEPTELICDFAPMPGEEGALILLRSGEQEQLTAVHIAPNGADASLLWTTPYPAWPAGCPLIIPADAGTRAIVAMATPGDEEQGDTAAIVGLDPAGELVGRLDVPEGDVVGLTLGDLDCDGVPELHFLPFASPGRVRSIELAEGFDGPVTEQAQTLGSFRGLQPWDRVVLRVAPLDEDGCDDLLLGVPGHPSTRPNVLGEPTVLERAGLVLGFTEPWEPGSTWKDPAMRIDADSGVAHSWGERVSDLQLEPLGEELGTQLIADPGASPPALLIGAPLESLVGDSAGAILRTELVRGIVGSSSLPRLVQGTSERRVTSFTASTGHLGYSIRARLESPPVWDRTPWRSSIVVHRRTDGAEVVLTHPTSETNLYSPNLIEADPELLVVHAYRGAPWCCGGADRFGDVFVYRVDDLFDE